MSERPFPELYTNRLILRRLTESDFDDIKFLRSDNEVNRYISRPSTENMEEAIAFIHKISSQYALNEILYWCITMKKSLEMIGTICLWNFSKDRKVAEIGYELKPSFQNQGLMNEAMERIIDFGFNHLLVNKIEAYTHRENQSSLKLLKRHNFRLEKNRIDKNNSDNVIFVLYKQNNKI